MQLDAHTRTCKHTCTHVLGHLFAGLFGACQPLQQVTVCLSDRISLACDTAISEIGVQGSPTKGVRWLVRVNLRVLNMNKFENRWAKSPAPLTPTGWEFYIHVS